MLWVDPVAINPESVAGDCGMAGKFIEVSRREGYLLGATMLGGSPTPHVIYPIYD